VQRPQFDENHGYLWLKKQHQAIKDMIAQKLSIERHASTRLAAVHDLVEWNFFERTVERIIREFNKTQIGELTQSVHSSPPVSEIMTNAIIHSQDQYVHLLYSVGLDASQSQHHQVTAGKFHESSKLDHLYFGRYQWHRCKDLQVETQGFSKAMITGCPSWICLPIWKSLGKTDLMKILVSQVLFHTIEFKSTRQPSAFDLLQELGNKVDLSKYQDCAEALADLERQDGIHQAIKFQTSKLVKCYLALAECMDEYEPRSSGVSTMATDADPLLAGVTLRAYSKILLIAEKLCHLYEDHVAHYKSFKSTLESQGHINLLRYSTVTEEDLFYILMAICIIFLPEHFLVPLPNCTAGPNQIATLGKLGIQLDQVFDNRMFISSSAIGDYKLAILFAECIRKSDSEVYYRLNNLGFPFTSFCLENTETLLVRLFNDTLLAKIWNLIFFEGSSNVKRRAQQAMLSAIVALVKKSSNLIMASQSADEVYWHLSRVGKHLYDCTEFMSQVVKIKKDLFVQNEVEVVAWIEDVVNLDPRLETQLQRMKVSMHEQLDGVANTNFEYLNFLSHFSSALPSANKAGRLKDAAQAVADIFHSLEIKSEMRGQSTVQNLTLSVGDTEYTFNAKPQPKRVSLQVCHFSEGHYRPNSSALVIRSSVSNTKINISLAHVDFLHSRMTGPSAEFTSWKQFCRQ
jgi:hypothetical protein